MKKSFIIFCNLVIYCPKDHSSRAGGGAKMVGAAAPVTAVYIGNNGASRTPRLPIRSKILLYVIMS